MYIFSIWATFLAFANSADGSKSGDIESSIETLEPLETRTLNKENYGPLFGLLAKTNHSK